MRERDLKALDRRLERFLEETTACMGRSERRRWAGYYLRGLLLDGERKSIEPLARRVGADVQGLQQFVGQSPWPAEELLEALNQTARRLLAPASYWVIDETSFPKQGPHSVGVARQYCGTLGKIANCQIAVSLHWSNADMSWPMGWRLYLPQSWIEDPIQRKKADIPQAVVYESKPQLALQLIEEALKQGMTPGTVLADQLYGNGLAWRAKLHEKKLSYCVAVEASTGVWLSSARDIPTCGRGRPRRHPPRGAIMSLREVAAAVPEKEWQQITWREGTKGPQRSRFYSVEVWAANRSGENQRIERWSERALIEWPPGEASPVKYWLCWLHNEEPTLLDLVQRAKARWRVEQDYRELKEELGLDHFEGRGWMGWHHHVALVTMAYVFLRLEQHRRKKNSAHHPADDSTPVNATVDTT